MITKVFHEHGIPLGASANNVALATEMPLNPPVAGGEWKILEASPISASRTTLGTSGRFSVRGKTSALPGTEARLLWFTEQKTNWKLPMGEAQIVQQLSVDAGKGVTHVLTTSPSVLYSLDMSNNNLVETPMDRFLDSAFSNRFRLQMACLKDQLAIFDPDVGYYFSCANRLVLIVNILCAEFQTDAARSCSTKYSTVRFQNSFNKFIWELIIKSIYS